MYSCYRKTSRGNQRPIEQLISEYCQSGWPRKRMLPEQVKPYLAVAAEFSIVYGLLMRGSRIVITCTLRKEMLQKIHRSHQGITKYQEHRRQSVWWPRIWSEIEDMFRQCHDCCKTQNQRTQPMKPSSLPQLPWQKVASDLFEWKQKHFLLIVDYYSRYVEIACLNNLTAEEEVTQSKSIFARHGIPEVDNGPQNISELYAKFSEEYQFQHITSSPYHPQGNGEAERTIKSMLEKCEDPYQALLAYLLLHFQLATAHPSF